VAAKKSKPKPDSEETLEDTARLFLKVFSSKYKDDFERMLVAGGGGNSMFVNAWAKPSTYFVKTRISNEAKERLQKHRHTLKDMPKKFFRNNAKTVDKRRAAKKELHVDHNPGNVKVLHLIRDKVRSFPETNSEDENLKELKEFLRTVQTIDIITIEQDEKRTLKDEDGTYSKADKAMMTAVERDALLDDDFEETDEIDLSLY
jgi:hypothetical protein